MNQCSGCGETYLQALLASCQSKAESNMCFTGPTGFVAQIP
jgi:hypothetical protein